MCISEDGYRRGGDGLVDCCDAASQRRHHQQTECSLTFQWVSGHALADGNEEADAQANLVRSLPQEDIPIDCQGNNTRHCEGKNGGNRLKMTNT